MILKLRKVILNQKIKAACQNYTLKLCQKIHLPAGLLRILDDKTFAIRNRADNETIFHLLQVATFDGTAAHLVDKYEEQRDGRMSYQELVKWYEGDDLTTETAEDIRSKIDKLFLSSTSSASNYINSFLQLVKLLEDLGEGYTRSKTISIFIDQITDPDYAATKENCVEDKLTLEQCIERIRSKERRLGREKMTSRKGLKIRRDKIEELDSRSSESHQGEISIDRYKNDLGFYSIPSDTWRRLSRDDQDMIKKFNGNLRRKRERDNSGNKKYDGSRKTGITQRRTPIGEPELKRLMTTRNNDESKQNEVPPNKDYEEGPDEEDDKPITIRRDLIRFNINK